MATRIRLKRMGAKKQAFYRVVVSDSRSPRDGRFIETLGYYNPLTKPADIKINEERLNHWLATGASPSESVVAVLRQKGITSAPATEAVAAAPAETAEVETAAVEE